ncbi:hypothetical protein [Deinococcus xinjiangensis]|uniref:hypothetical protein n=1 Tax=Deinococcus xinjiangensis TaxID=457454 RepID=UPI0033659083
MKSHARRVQKKSRQSPAGGRLKNVGTSKELLVDLPLPFANKKPALGKTGQVSGFDLLGLFA